MAREFTGGASGDRLASTSNTADTTLRSIAYWALVDSIDTTARRFHDWANAGGSFIYNVSSANKYEYQLRTNGTTGAWRCDPFSTGVWTHVCVTLDASSMSNDPIIYFNGASQTVTETSTPTTTAHTGTSQMFIGNRTGGDRTLDGKMAEFARWDRILTPAEVGILADGFSPLFVREPVQYLPLIGRNSTEPDLVGGVNGTVTTAANFPHPRIIYPSNYNIAPFSAAAAPSAIPNKLYQFNQAVKRSNYY